jgi:hypothetical protein
MPHYKVREELLFLRPSPAMKVRIAIKKEQLSTLTTVYPIFSPTIHSLLF